MAAVIVKWRCVIVKWRGYGEVAAVMVKWRRLW